MKPEELEFRNFESEFIYSTSRSSGPGGQNINKVNSKVELRLNILYSMLFSEEEKALIFRKLSKKINKEGELILTSQTERTQLLNKIIVTEKFFSIVSAALTPRAERRSTQPTLASVKKRLEEKRIHGLKKKLRKQSDESLDK
jgi:ribosome-associated protein